MGGASLGACGSERDEPGAKPANTLTTPEMSAYCGQWPGDAIYCDGTPLLSGEAAVRRAVESGVLNKKDRLVSMSSAPFGGLTPDGDLVLKGDGWWLVFDDNEGNFERIDVRAAPPKPVDVLEQSATYCQGEQIVPDGISSQVKQASEIFEANYGVDFEPGTFRLYVERKAPCAYGGSMARTLVQLQLQERPTAIPHRALTVEFDAKGQLVGSCEDGYEGRGCSR